MRHLMSAITLSATLASLCLTGCGGDSARASQPAATPAPASAAGTAAAAKPAADAKAGDAAKAAPAKAADPAAAKAEKPAKPEKMAKAEKAPKAEKPAGEDAAKAAKPAKEPKPAKAPEEPKEVISEFQVIYDTYGLADAEKAAFKKAWDEREAAMKAWNEDQPKGKQLAETRAALDAAKASGDEAAITKAQAAHEPLSTEHWKERSALRAKVLGTLSPEHQDRFVGEAVYDRVIYKSMRRSHLTDEQKVKAKAICIEVAAPVVTPELIQADPYMKEPSKQIHDKAVERITAEVLTAEQREAAAPKPKAEAAPAAAPAAPAAESKAEAK